MKNVCRWMEQGMYTGKILEQFNKDELFIFVALVWVFFPNTIDFFRREILFTLVRVCFS